jgi:hypothetical protein
MNGFQVRDLLPVKTVVLISFEIEGRTIRVGVVVLYASAFEEGSSRDRAGE